jgi:ketosteroid isomerase-like protein
MDNNWKRRDVIGFGGAAALAAAVGINGAAPASAASEAKEGKALVGDAERNKRLLREHREASQMRALPSALPGEEGKFDRRTQTPLVGLTPKSVMVSNDSPILPGMSPADRALIGSGFPSQALGPTFLSYGPMLAEGNLVVEEWESQIYGANGTLYNNQYLWILRFEGDQVVEMHEYNDTQHAAITFGPLGKWPELKPPTSPRRRNQHGVKTAPLPASEIETVFEIVDKFDLDPRLLRDVVPSASAPPVRVQPGIEGNKALVRALRKARAAGDPAVVNSFYAKGFRHFIGGERPFGWDHLPLEEIYAPLVKHLASPLTLRYGPMIAEGDRVFEQVDSFARLDDGTVYNNWHAFVHDIRDGKIVQTREYHDPRHVWVVLGRWAPWGSTPVPPRSTPRRSNLQGIATTIQYPTGGGPDLERWRPFVSLPG